MNFFKYITAILISILIARPSVAADDPSVYVGIGASSCSSIISAAKKGMDLRYDITVWAQGFVSGANFINAVNKHANFHFDATEVKNKAWPAVSAYCEEHPLSNVEKALIEMMFELPTYPLPERNNGNVQ